MTAADRTDVASGPDGLATALADGFGIDAVGITSKPGGATADAFLVEEADGRSLWVKAFRPHPYDEAAADAIRIANLRLLHEFHERGIDVDVPNPWLAADGRLFTTWRGGMLVCFDYVDGRPFDWTSAVDSALLGRAVATIHRATAVLGDAVPGPAREVVADLDALVAAVPDLAAETAAVVARCAELDPRVRDATPHVLCHTDLTPWNLIVTPDGRLTALDWDEAGTAPPEQDLIFTLGAGSPGTGDVAAFWSGYRAAGGEPYVDFGTLEWALLNRHIDDMMFDVGLLNAPDVPDADRAQLRANVVAYGPGEWRQVVQRLALARRVFRP
jgi:aminoglycoside phosphotransferase (APT) family kinase protein